MHIMTVKNIFLWFQDTPVSTFLQTSNHLVVEVIGVLHVLGLVLLLAALLLVNLRLLGVGLRSQSARQLASDVAPLLWTGLGLTLFSGTVLFLSAAMNYYANPAFLPKLFLLLLATIVQMTLYRKATATESPSPALARTTAITSLTLWLGVGLAGRAIGYV
jgi:hypothetical protein